MKTILISNIKLHIILYTISLIIPMTICHQTATYLSVWPWTYKNLKFHLPSVNKSTHFCNVYSVPVVYSNSRCYILSKVFLYDRCFICVIWLMGFSSIISWRQRKLFNVIISLCINSKLQHFSNNTLGMHIKFPSRRGFSLQKCNTFFTIIS
jgi:hypothetical protein